MGKKKKKPTKPRRKTKDQLVTATAVLGGGAPLSPLMSGALAAIYDKGKTFNQFYTSGAGAMVALLYLAARGANSSAALAGSISGGSVADEIFRFVPVNYKIFYKPGPFTKPIRRWTNLFKVRADPMSSDARGKRLYNDWLDLWAAVITPTWFSYQSKGLCQPYPFVEDVLDFDKLQRFKGDFKVNAYNIPGGHMEQFHKWDMNVKSFAAAFAYPFIMQPVSVNGIQYSEGADQDPLNLHALHDYLLALRLESHTVVLMDVLGSLRKALIRDPLNLLDAYGIQIMTPVVSLAESKLKEFCHTYDPADYNFQKLRFRIPPEHAEQVTHWSSSNMTRLWKIGYEKGEHWVEHNGHLLPDRDPEGPSPAKPDPRFVRADPNFDLEDLEEEACNQSE